MVVADPIQPAEEPGQAELTLLSSTHPHDPANLDDMALETTPMASTGPTTATLSEESMHNSTESLLPDATDTQSTYAHAQTTVTADRPSSPSTRSVQRDESREAVINRDRPLNVRDALTYLDQVKIKFTDQPNVYNLFLDIMKDFKSQTIDTPGIIEQVSSIFRGHPSLIAGFNTFLPPGYCIECSTDERSRDIIKITTPTGSTITTPGGRVNLRSNDSRLQNRQRPAEASQDEHPNGDKNSPVEFKHAIKYINKIKNRFAKDPEKYKQFLEILQTYQKEQSPIQQVYVQVRVLFDDAEDLLGEFKQFLPDTSGQQTGVSASLFASGALGGGISLQGRKKRGAGLTATQAKRSKLNPELKIETSDVRGGVSPAAGVTRPLISAEETEFFDQVETHINDKMAYDAFLKALNEFTEQTVDQNALISRVEKYIGGNKGLFYKFKALVGYDGKDEVVENLPAVTARAIQRRRGSWGPSYRAIPKSAARCSGRDTLCWRVLNDIYVSHPLWTSEDNGCVTLKKNRYEEALHRVEEERYDYDLNIEANLNAIALLEPIAKKISGMSTEEKVAFRLPPGLGGSSEAIYKRVIKKIYGADQGVEIIELLHSNPSQTVNIVLKRLRQKDDEWKRAQREWNKIWRQVESVSFYKSLDHRGITFKAEDKKRLQASVMLEEIEKLRESQKGRQTPQLAFEMKDAGVFNDISWLLSIFLPHQQLGRSSDIESLRHFIEEFIPLVFSIMDTNSDDEMPMESVVEEDKVSMEDVENETEEARQGVTQEEEDRENGRDEDEDENDGEGEGDDDDDEEDEDDEDDEIDEGDDEDDEESKTSQWYDPEDDSFTSRPTSRRTRARSSRTTTRRVREDKSRSPKSMPRRSENHGTQRIGPDEMDVDVPQAEAPRSASALRKMYNFFCNSKFYRFFRLYQITYHRLSLMKSIDLEFKKSPEKAKAAKVASFELGVTAKEVQGLKIDFDAGYYKSLLRLVSKLVESDADQLDQYLYEDCMRYIFGTKAYMMFTFERLLMLLLQSIQHIVEDPTSQELIDLFNKDHALEQTDAQVLGNYRIQAERVIGNDESEDERVFSVGFDTMNRILSIQLLGKDDVHANKAFLHEAPDNKTLLYEEYVTSYMKWNSETTGVSQATLTPQFLKRNLKASDDQTKLVITSGMQYKICRDTYHMFYIIGTEDACLHQRPPRKQTNRAIAQSKKWKAWLASKNDNGQTEIDATKAHLPEQQ